VSERLSREPLPLRKGEAAGRDRSDDNWVCRRVNDDGNRGMVLGRRAHHRRPTDIDLLDALIG
jgi:hypothetical protein